MITQCAQVFDFTPLLEATQVRTDARADYFEILTENQPVLEVCQASLAAADEAMSQCEDAAAAIGDYFEENIIHKGISTHYPVDGSWMQVPVLGGRFLIYTRSDEEVNLIAAFIQRRQADFAELIIKSDATEKEFAEARLDLNGKLIESREPMAEIRIAEFKARLADIKRKYEYVKFLRCYIDSRQEASRAAAGM